MRSSNKYDAQKPNTPKSARERVVVPPVPTLTDAARRLGHAPRPRKARR